MSSLLLAACTKTPPIAPLPPVTGSVCYKLTQYDCEGISMCIWSQGECLERVR